MKTKHHTFTSGLQEYSLEPKFGGETLFYGDTYYTLTNKRTNYLRDKTIDSRFLVLSLFGISYELGDLQIDASNQLVELDLLVGLPPAHYKAQYQDFEQYFMQNNREYGYKFNGKDQYICIKEARAYPQALAANQRLFQSVCCGYRRYDSRLPDDVLRPV